MNRTIFASCAAALLLTATTAAAQTTYFATDFESGMPEGVALHDVDQNEPSTDTRQMGFAVGTPWVVLTTDKDTNHAAASTSWYKKGAQSNDWLVLPAVSVVSAQTQLQWRSMASDKDYADGFKVYISEQGNTPADFDTAAPILSVSKENAAWTQHAVSLEAYSGKTVYIAFVNDSKDKALLYVDDIFVGVPSKVGLTLDLARCYDGYGDITVSGQALATGTEAVTGYTVGFQMGDVTLTEHYDGTLLPGTPVSFSFSQPVHLERLQTADYTAWIESGDDRAELSSRLSAYPWKVVSEEVTGTWCQYCVRGIGAMNYMRQNFSDGFIGIAIHNDGSPTCPDSMAIPGEEYRQWVMNNYSMQGYPHCVLNRNAQYSIDPGNIPDQCAKIKATTQNYFGLDLTASYEPSTGRISATTQVAFARDYEGANFRLAYIVIENDVHRTHAETGILNNYCGYDQVNAYAGGSMGSCYGFENLPSIVNADDIWYQDVARGYAGTDGYKGTPDLFPTTISEGDQYSHSTELDMPATVLKPENTELVVLLLNKSGNIVNAEKCSLATGVDAIRTATAADTAADAVYYSLSGQRVEHPAKGIYVVNGKKVVVK